MKEHSPEGEVKVVPDILRIHIHCPLSYCLKCCQLILRFKDYQATENVSSWKEEM